MFYVDDNFLGLKERKTVHQVVDLIKWSYDEYRRRPDDVTETGSHNVDETNIIMLSFNLISDKKVYLYSIKWHFHVILTLFYDLHHKILTRM